VVNVVPARLEWLHALAEGDEVFSARFGISVVTGWVGFPEALPVAIGKARRRPEDPWGTHLFFDDDGALVGFGGFKGAPAHGEVELGYAVAPGRQGRGITTAVVEELVHRARVAGCERREVPTPLPRRTLRRLCSARAGSLAPVSYAIPTATSGVGSGRSVRPNNTGITPNLRVRDRRLYGRSAVASDARSFPW
jgi:ribosomal-protein-alanine N-acetyltransferase